MAAPRELDLSDEVEGEIDRTTDFVFRLVGDPIPFLPPASAPLPLFDLQSPPARPLAVSDRHAAVFLAHPNGFIAAMTKALIEASKEAREKGKASTRCAQDCCVTDVPLPGVTLLALSCDESELAACTGSEIQFFSATSLLTDKDIKASSSCSMGRSGTVKDFKWLDNAYIVLSNGGLLSHGSLGQGLKDIMENVDAVDCCKDGNHIAVARKNSLRILSSDLKETCCMTLLFQLWPDSDSEGTEIKVDSIGWVRNDIIVIGCVRLNEKSNEEGYLVQVIRSGGDTFFESSSKPVVSSYDVFGGIMDDNLPSGVGPNLLLGYLHRWDLLVVTNKKSTHDHISLLKWSSRTDEERTVVYFKMADDKYSPRIDLQENGDNIVILGFGVENVSLLQKTTVLFEPEQKEVAPQHLLLCLTSEGKLIIYYLARVSDPSDLPQTSLSTIEDSIVNKQISPATASNKDLSTSVTSSRAKSLLAGHGMMATHDGSKAKKEKDPGESCRRLFSAVCKKLTDERKNYEAEPDKYMHTLITDTDDDWTLIRTIEEKLNVPTDCAEPPTEYYNKLSKELMKVTKRINGRKYAYERNDLVKTLQRSIHEICQVESTGSFPDKQRKTAAMQAHSWLQNRLKEQELKSIYEDPSLTCKDIDNRIKALKQEKKPIRTDLGEVKGLFNASETTPTGSLFKDYMTTIPIPSRLILAGETLFEIFSVDTNLSLIKTIVLYDDKGGTLVYKSKEGDKENFIRRRSKWLSKHTRKTAADFTDSLILRGPTRPMTAHEGCWIFEINVPIESSFGSEDSEFYDKMFETTLSLDADYIDKPRCSLLSIRGGFINLSTITFSNAVRSTIRFAFDGPSDVSSDGFKGQGELTLFVDGYDAKFTILKSSFKSRALVLFPVDRTQFEVPLLRHVLALPLGCRVHVKGNLKFGRQKVHVDKYLVLNRDVVEVQWHAVPSITACISIELSAYP